MPDENHGSATSAAEEGISTPLAATAGPGATPVGLVGIILIKTYLVVATSICLYGLIILWPIRSTADGSAPTATTSASAPSSAPKINLPSPITMFGLRPNVSDEVRLLLITILAGALGSLVRALRSVYWYVGNRQLVRSWLGQYMLLPFVGSALAVIFYVVVRGGFFSPQATFEQTSPFGFAALAAMVGLFSEQAVLKLKQVAETVLTKPAPGNDNVPQESDS
jgi:hypothetical protein